MCSHFPRCFKLTILFVIFFSHKISGFMLILFCIPDVLMYNLKKKIQNDLLRGLLFCNLSIASTRVYSLVITCTHFKVNYKNLIFADSINFNEPQHSPYSNKKLSKQIVHLQIPLPFLPLLIVYCLWWCYMRSFEQIKINLQLWLT